MPRMHHRSLTEHAGNQPQYYQVPGNGVAPNGLPYFSWDQAAQQLARANASWTGEFGEAVNVTYAFRASGTVPAGMGISQFAQFNEAQIIATERALQFWSEVCNITFTRVGSGTTGAQAYSNNATMLFGNFVNGPPQFSAFAYLPDPAATGAAFEEGDVWVNVSRDYDANPLAFPLGARILLHEIGHTLGLLHPSIYDGGAGSGLTYAADADYYQDTHQFTVQSYFAETSTGAYFGGHGITPMMHDIAAAQLIYGANMTTRTGDTTYGFNSNAGNAAFAMTSATDRPVFCIWDAGGIDTLDLSGYSTASQIDLRTESFSSAGTDSGGVALIGNISIARGAIIENAIGGGGADTIIGNSEHNVLRGNGGADTITGGDGHDTLDGGAGADRLDGGAGNDTIFWDAGDVLANIQGGSGSDLIVFTSGAAPTTFNLVTHGFEAAEGRFTDTGANAWATRTDLYDSLWRIDFSTLINDNGTRELTDYDAPNSLSWTSYWQRFDTLNRLTEAAFVFDNGTRESVNYDAANANSWSLFFWKDDALARRTESVLIYDDNSSDSSNYDAADAFNWDQFWWKEDSVDRRTEAVLVYDDGALDSNNYDAVDAFDWTEFFWKEDALGRRLESVLINDDASRDSRNYDAVDAFAWEDFWWRQDTLGRRTEDILTYDDGSRDVKDYDETASFTWASIWRHYDSGGTLTQTITTYDDGSVVIA